MATSDGPPVSVPDITLAVARPAGNGGGSSPTGAPSISSVTDNGDGTLTILGSNFGTKTQPAPALHDLVAETYERGVLNNYNSGISDDVALSVTDAGRIYTTTSSFVRMKSDSGIQRVAGGRVYRGDAGATLREPLKFEQDERTAGHRQFYMAWRFKPNFDPTYMWDAKPQTAPTGSLVPGESVLIDGAIPGTFVGASGDWLYLVIPGYRSANDSLKNKTVVGQTSGESFVFPDQKYNSAADVYGYGSVGTKLARVWDNPNGSNGIRGSLTSNDFYVADYEGGVSNGRVINVVNPVSLLPDSWHLLEFEVDLENGYARMVIDGELRGEGTFTGGIGDEAFSPTISQVGLNGGPVEFIVFDIDEVYMDSSLQRVYLGNASTFGACTSFELQRPTAWADDSVSVSKNLGALAGGWLYVVGPNGEINESGGLL